MWATMTREDRATWLEEWADECGTRAFVADGNGDTGLGAYWAEKEAFLFRLAHKIRNPDGYMMGRSHVDAIEVDSIVGCSDEHDG